MTLVNPNTGRSFDHDRMLAELQDWTRQLPIIKAMIVTDVADAPGIVALAASIRLALEGNPKGMTEVQAAGALVQILANDRVRQKVARHVARKHGLEEWQAEEGLIQMAEHVAEMIPGEANAGH